MHKFALEKIDLVKGKINFFKLIIDNRCKFDEFCNELIEGGEEKALISLYATMDAAANLKHPKNFKELKRDSNDKIKDYEIKKNIKGLAMRIYLFDDSGRVVVFGSFKKTQEEDINTLRRIKNEYFQNKENDQKRRDTKK